MRRLLTGLIACTAAIAPVWAAEPPPIVLDAAQRQALGVREGVAAATVFVPLDGLPARVRAPLQDSAVVTAPFAGMVVAVLAREGEDVRRGQPLARIQSREAMRLGADLAAARGAYRVADAQVVRDRQLLDEGIIPAARLQEAEARRDAAQARLRELQAARAMAPAASAAAPGTYELRAPLDGRVAERAVHLGEPVADLAKAFVVARRDRAMLELRVPARYAARLRTGLGVRTEDGGEGRVAEIGAAVDAASQTVLARADMREAGVLPGTLTSATLLLPAPAGALELPAAAVVEQAGRKWVFVATDAGYRVVEVSVLAQTADGRCVVQGPLAPGARVVVAGAGAMKALLGEGR